MIELSINLVRLTLSYTHTHTTNKRKLEADARANTQTKTHMRPPTHPPLLLRLRSIIDYFHVAAVSLVQKYSSFFLS